MVREPSKRVCGLQDMKCYKRVEEESLNLDWCDCYLECGEIEYKSEQQQNEFLKPLYQVKSRDYMTSFGLASQIQILFKSAQFFPSILRQQLTTLDFVSYCGGSLGLFLGFSALSAVEIVYYFTLRICFKRLRKKKVASLEERVEEKQNYLVEVMKSSSIHGCNQTVMDYRHRFERLSLEFNQSRMILSLLSLGLSGC
jgi:hypothetical protein